MAERIPHRRGILYQRYIMATSATEDCCLINSSSPDLHLILIFFYLISLDILFVFTCSSVPCSLVFISEIIFFQFFLELLVLFQTSIFLVVIL